MTGPLAVSTILKKNFKLPQNHPVAGNILISLARLIHGIRKLIFIRRVSMIGKPNIPMCYKFKLLPVKC